MNISNSQWTNDKSALHSRIAILPRDRVDNSLTELSLALESDILAELHVALHIDGDLGRVLVLAPQERRPLVVLVAHTQAEPVVDVRVDLDHVVVSVVQDPLAQTGVTNHVA